MIKRAHVKGTRGVAATVAAMFIAALALATAMKFPPAAAAQPRPHGGDGIFTPIISPVAIDRTGRPITVEEPQPEPNLAPLMIAGKPTGDSYVINFPQGPVGGDCAYTGKGRYLIENSGTLTFQILADCGKLRRSYGYMICRLNEELHCSEGPWWYFKNRKFGVTDQGVVIDSSTVVPWSDPAQAPQELQAMLVRIKSMNDRFRGATNVVHSRTISCRNYRPASQSYEIHELPTTCAIQSLCNGIPNVDSLRDGDVIDWNSPVGNYIRQQQKISDTSTWVCWIRTQ